MGPVQAVGEPDGVGGGVGPADHLVGVVHDPAGPEESLGVLGDQTVELILLGGGVQGDRLHPHRVAVLLRLVLLEAGAADLPGDDVPVLLALYDHYHSTALLVTLVHYRSGWEQPLHTYWFRQKY